ncbi:aromatic amino acid lyase [Streptomyces rishiriensis]|uniref:Histidine ammonia-lyase n=1 Tax=Streptomyces rishiriensis TaxID=68264 RepID=A0ABU0NZZ9_STRRH|nr:aromatic amino acid lyase [Streptomyces rishiriensis]MDQ0584097.1 histidine ammonia-lyase [Streptomyces rishiriensis]
MDTTANGATRVPPQRGDARIVLNGTALTVGELIALVDGEAVPVVAPEARERAALSWRTAQRLAAVGRLYGRGTGVGAHRSVPVDEGDEAAHGLRLLRSHAGGAGAPLPARQVRAMLAVRANQLLAGGSGIQPALIDALVDALRLGVHPAVNEYGGVGTGDLTALAQTGLTLIGERPWLRPELTEPGVTPEPEGRTTGRLRQAGQGEQADQAQRAERGSSANQSESDARWAGRSWTARTAGPTGSAAADAPGDEPGTTGTESGTETVAAARRVVDPVVRLVTLPGPAARTVYVPVCAPTPVAAADSAPGAAPAPGLPAPVVLQPGDALALLSSNALALGQAALAQRDLDVLLRATHAVAALSLAAVSGSPEAYAAPVHALRPYPGAARAAGEVRRLLGLPDRPQGRGRRIQDPFGFRAFPQAHGCALDASERLREVIEVEVNCPSENPLMDPDRATAYHHGGFFAAPLGLALDAAVLALLQTAQLSAARLTALGDPGLTGLPAFLGGGPSSSSGTMILEYTANSALAELRSAATPASAGHAVLSRGLEEAASFAGQAARQTSRATDAYTTVLACELVVAVRALRMRPGQMDSLSPPGAVLAAATAVLPTGLEDRPLTGDVLVAAELLPVLAEL